MPATESRLRKGAVRATALVALGVTAAYLAWRLTGTINLAWWWVAIPLFLVELHNGLGLVLYTIALWDVDARPPAADAPEPGLRVAVLIPTYNEPVEVLLPTIAASVALEPEHETWVLDDGRRAEVRDLSVRLGARYLARSDNRHAKAGNLNHALARIDADIIAVLDADHVPTARFLVATLPYFRDDRLAFVQTPQDFYNLESFEHQRRRTGQVFNEEAVFYRVIAPAKSRWSAPFWCGTCALVRVAALRSVGGVAVDSVTEDIHTTIRMYRAGWRGAYHNEVLARGLAPDDAASYLLQRNRWALGAMQVLRQENPLFGPGLTMGQRLAFFTMLFGWFDSWRTLAYMLIPLAVVATGAVPISAPGMVFAPFFLVTLTIQFVALRLLARGHYPPFLSMLFEVLRMPAVLPATLALFWPRRAVQFRVTPKGRQGGARRRAAVPGLLKVLATASLLGLGWCAVNLAGIGPLRYAVPWAAAGAAFFIAVNEALLVAAIARIRTERFGGNRRASARLPIVVSAELNGIPCSVRDLSVTGARVAVRAETAVAGDQVDLALRLGGRMVVLQGAVRRVRDDATGSVELGIEYLPAQETKIAELAVAVFHPPVPSQAGNGISAAGSAAWESVAA
ncbi:MAG: glycosyltransferase [Candidatus Limnocylindrales bacterium]